MEPSAPDHHKTRRHQRHLEEAVEFASLPDEALVPQAVVESVLCISHMTCHRMRRDGRLPQPIKLTARAVRWRVGDLRKALAAMAG